VPYPYFHVVKIMLLIALTMTGYALIFVLHGMPVFTVGCFAIICLIMIGLQEIAAAMSDPFGDDEIDFDGERQLATAFNNAVALLMDYKPPDSSHLPAGLSNPLTFARPIKWEASAADGDRVFTSSGTIKSRLAKARVASPAQRSEATRGVNFGGVVDERAAFGGSGPSVGLRQSPNVAASMAERREERARLVPRQRAERAELEEVEVMLGDEGRCSKSSPVRTSFRATPAALYSGYSNPTGEKSLFGGCTLPTTSFAGTHAPSDPTGEGSWRALGGREQDYVA